MPQVSYKTKVVAYLNKLEELLLVKDYFSSRVSAKEYVDRIINAIEREIHLKPHKIVPLQISNKGKYYTIFNTVSKNKRTSWIVFFQTMWSKIVGKI